jgi:hypothetical protein
MSAKPQRRTRLRVYVTGTFALSLGLLMPSGAWAISFSDWASGQGYGLGDAMPDTVGASFADIC